MEFLFLTQDIYLEILILIGLILVLLGIWGHDCYVWISRIITAMKATRQIPVISDPIVPPSEETLPETNISETNISETDLNNASDLIKKTEAIEKPIVEKTDTSHVEKLTNIVSSVRTLIARGMNHEAQTLIVE